MPRQILSGLLFLILATALLQAQEVQIPFDSSGRVEVISRELEEKLNIFPDAPNFEEARLYRVTDSLYALEIIEAHSGVRSRTRKELNAAEFEALRRRVTDLIAARSPSSVLNQEGRSRLIVSTTLLGLTYYGWAIPAALGVEDEKAFTTVYLLTAGASFIVPFLATSNSQVTKAQANLATYGLYAGLVHGGLLYVGLGGDDEIDGQGLLGVAAAVGLAEGVTGYMIARDMSEATANMIGTYGIYGGVFGALTGGLMGVEDGNGFALLTLLGSYGGSIVGNAMTRWDHYSIGDASVVSTATAIGTLTPPALLAMAEYDDDEKVYAGLTMAGMIGGGILGHNLIAGREFSEAHGNYITLGTIAGSAVGLAVGYLISEESPSIIGGGLLGGLGAFAIMYNTFEDEAQVGRTMGGLRLQASPAGIGAALTDSRPARGFGSIPIVAASYSF